MSRRARIRYPESSEDANDGQKRYYYSEKPVQRRQDLLKWARLLQEKAAAISAVRRSSSPIRITTSRAPAGAQESHSSNEGSGEDDEVIGGNGGTYVFDGNELRFERNVGGHNRPGHITASKLRRQGPKSLSDICNKNTISKDNTIGSQAQMDGHLANFGKREFGRHCHELRKIPDPFPEWWDLNSIWKCYFRNIGKVQQFRSDTGQELLLSMGTQFEYAIVLTHESFSNALL
ncbi:hypothetical protein ACHAP7_011250 [Fusarium lateritium]